MFSDPTWATDAYKTSCYCVDINAGTESVSGGPNSGDAPTVFIMLGMDRVNALWICRIYVHHRELGL